MGGCDGPQSQPVFAIWSLFPSKFSNAVPSTRNIWSQNLDALVPGPDKDLVNCPGPHCNGPWSLGPFNQWSLVPGPPSRVSIIRQHATRIQFVVNYIVKITIYCIETPPWLLLLCYNKKRLKEGGGIGKRTFKREGGLTKTNNDEQREGGGGVKNQQF